jgi:hypothetical protein
MRSTSTESFAGTFLLSFGALSFLRLEELMRGKEAEEIEEEYVEGTLDAAEEL